MSWKMNGCIAAYFAVLAVAAAVKPDWVWFAFSLVMVIVSLVLAALGRRRERETEAAVREFVTQLNKESDGRAHRKSDQGEEEGPVVGGDF